MFRILERVAVLALGFIFIVVLNSVQETAEHIRTLNKSRENPSLVTGALLVCTSLVKFANKEKDSEIANGARNTKIAKS